MIACYRIASVVLQIRYHSKQAVDLACALTRHRAHLIENGIGPIQFLSESDTNHFRPRVYANSRRGRNLFSLQYEDPSQ